MASIRLDKHDEYLEATCEGAVLCQRTGTVGGDARDRRTTLASAAAAKRALSELRDTKLRDGFRDTKAEDVKRRVAQYDALLDQVTELDDENRSATSTLEQILAELAWMATLGPTLRKAIRYPAGALRDVEVDRDRQRLLLACSVFADAERVYWKQHDPAAIPYFNMGTNGGVATPWLFALEAGLEKRWKAPSKPGRAPDYSAAKRQLEAIANDARSRYRDDARKILPIIALREGEPKKVLALLGVENGVVEVDDTCLAGSAYLALGDTTKAAVCFEKYVMNEAHLAEARGDLAAAERGFHESLHWGYSAKLYARLRLAALRRRIGARAFDRLVATREAEKNAGKIVISRVEEFFQRFPEIADAMRAKRGITTPKRPLDEAALAELRITTTRSGDGRGVTLPESVKTILRYDRNFAVGEGAPLLASLVGSRRSPLRSADIQKHARQAVARTDEPALRALARLPADVPVWNDADDLPACIPLMHPGDQLLFLYVGAPDGAGEYPLARFDSQQVELWISEASLIHYVLEHADDVVHCTVDFESLRTKAKKRNQHHREGWSSHPQVTALLRRV